MTEPYEIWRTIGEATGYEVSNLGRVRNVLTRRVLRATGRGNGSLGRVTLALDGDPITRGVRRLMATAFDVTEAGEKWVTCKDAYQYSVSSLGRVMNNKTGRILKPNAKGQVVLMDVGWRLCRSVSKLVKEHFES